MTPLTLHTLETAVAYVVGAALALLALRFVWRVLRAARRGLAARAERANTLAQAERNESRPVWCNGVRMKNAPKIPRDANNVAAAGGLISRRAMVGLCDGVPNVGGAKHYVNGVEWRERASDGRTLLNFWAPYEEYSARFTFADDQRALWGFPVESGDTLEGLVEQLDAEIAKAALPPTDTPPATEVAALTDGSVSVHGTPGVSKICNRCGHKFRSADETSQWPGVANGIRYCVECLPASHIAQEYRRALVARLGPANIDVRCSAVGDAYNEDVAARVVRLRVTWLASDGCSRREYLVDVAGGWFLDSDVALAFDAIRGGDPDNVTRTRAIPPLARARVAYGAIIRPEAPTATRMREWPAGSASGLASEFRDAVVIALQNAGFAPLQQAPRVDFYHSLCKPYGLLLVRWPLVDDGAPAIRVFPSDAEAQPAETAKGVVDALRAAVVSGPVRNSERVARHQDAAPAPFDAETFAQRFGADLREALGYCWAWRDSAECEVIKTSTATATGCRSTRLRISWLLHAGAGERSEMTLLVIGDRVTPADVARAAEQIAKSAEDMSAITCPGFEGKSPGQVKRERIARHKDADPDFDDDAAPMRVGEVRTALVDAGEPFVVPFRCKVEGITQQPVTTPDGADKYLVTYRRLDTPDSDSPVAPATIDVAVFAEEFEDALRKKLGNPHAIRGEFGVRVLDVRPATATQPQHIGVCVDWRAESSSIKSSYPFTIYGEHHTDADVRRVYDVIVTGRPIDDEDAAPEFDGTKFSRAFDDALRAKLRPHGELGGLLCGIVSSVKPLTAGSRVTRIRYTWPSRDGDATHEYLVDIHGEQHSDADVQRAYEAIAPKCLPRDVPTGAVGARIGAAVGGGARPNPVGVEDRQEYEAEFAGNAELGVAVGVPLLQLLPGDLVDQGAQREFVGPYTMGIDWASSGSHAVVLDARGSVVYAGLAAAAYVPPDPGVVVIARDARDRHALDASLPSSTVCPGREIRKYDYRMNSRERARYIAALTHASACGLLSVVEGSQLHAELARACVTLDTRGGSKINGASDDLVVALLLANYARGGRADLRGTNLLRACIRPLRGDSPHLDDALMPFVAPCACTVESVRPIPPPYEMESSSPPWYYYETVYRIKPEAPGDDESVAARADPPAERARLAPDPEAAESERPKPMPFDATALSFAFHDDLRAKLDRDYMTPRGLSCRGQHRSRGRLTRIVVSWRLPPAREASQSCIIDFLGDAHTDADVQRAYDQIVQSYDREASRPRYRDLSGELMIAFERELRAKLARHQSLPHALGVGWHSTKDDITRLRVSWKLEAQGRPGPEHSCHVDIRGFTHTDDELQLAFDTIVISRDPNRAANNAPGLDDGELPRTRYPIPSEHVQRATLFDGAVAVRPTYPVADFMLATSKEEGSTLAAVFAIQVERALARLGSPPAAGTPRVTFDAAKLPPCGLLLVRWPDTTDGAPAIRVFPCDADSAPAATAAAVARAIRDASAEAADNLDADAPK